MKTGVPEVLRGSTGALRPGLAAWLAGVPWPVMAAQSNPGIDPTLFVIGVAGAFAAGVAVGYAIGKSGSRSDQ